jgi:hypothetical protein
MRDRNEREGFIVCLEDALVALSEPEREDLESLAP